MTKAKKRTPLVEEVRPYVEGVAKNLVDKLYGPDGPPWGTKLTDIEHLLLAVRDVLTEKILAEALARQAATQAQRPPTYRCCPGCQQPFLLHGGRLPGRGRVGVQRLLRRVGSGRRAGRFVGQRYPLAQLPC